jgi:hypothetical protein
MARVMGRSRHSVLRILEMMALVAGLLVVGFSGARVFVRSDRP